MQKNYHFIPDILKLFSHSTFGASYFCLRPTTSAVKRLLPLPLKSSIWDPLITTSIWAVLRLFDSLAALFQGTYPKISS